MDSGSFDDAEVPTYLLAARAASKTYGLSVPPKPIFLRWSEEPSTALSAMYGEATRFVIFAGAVFFVIVPIMSLLLSCFDLALTGRENDEHWHTDKVKVMKYGIDIVPKTWGREIQLDLMNMRCYWSGEVIYDYAFHIANKHMYLGVLFSHPAHPYSKWERLVVCIIVSLFIVFPISAFSVKFGQEGIAHLVAVVCFVTLPRNVLKLYLISIAQQDAYEELEGGHKVDGDRVRNALAWELGFLAFCALICGLTVAICTLYIRSATTMPVGEVLRNNCDGLGFAFVLEPIFDLVVPFVGLDSYEGTWTLGFFGRWRRERDYYAAQAALVPLPGTPVQPYSAAAAAASPAAVPTDVAAAMRQLESSRGALPRPRPLFRDAGTEILLAPEAQFRQRHRRAKLAEAASGGYDPAMFANTGYWQAQGPFETMPPPVVAVH